MNHNKMTALVLKDYSVKAFTKMDLEIPVPAAGEVLVKIAASGVNPIDYKIREGSATYATPELPAVLGTDMAGVVIAVGDNVSNFSVGDEVYGLTGGVRGLQGSLAQYAAVDADLIARKPANLSMREAAALPLVFLTAWEGLVDRAGVKAGDKVFVQGGSGGVGHMVIQLARIFGADVWASGSAEKQEMIASFGATPINYREKNVDECVSEYTAGKGFDIIYDTVGGATLSASLSAVKHYGHITSCYAFGEFNIAPSSLRCATLSAVFVLLPMLSGEGRAHHGDILRTLTGYVEAGKIRPIVDPRRFSLDTALEAHNAQENGSALIKIVIDIE
ncbi:zinc-dependent alcohol dehydrogenase family protein [Citrobacter freundii]|uniref:zinc-dependent alcohol dehydrogenase family protein n=1 Tax=Citrobacter TaxID=544 RepID=UPI00214D9F57|nr:MULTISPECIES: zinc-dependent alcohol dehydrogenase family protein [Citrobacter]MCR3713752.1 zinc-dependent alcohol dehydrogenase family protein [Citrobacter freundii]MDM3231780.1 zinc-dependent alcohol dehydrogenase family protein [Citrobacter sp. Cf078]